MGMTASIFLFGNPPLRWQRFIAAVNLFLESYIIVHTVEFLATVSKS